MTPSPMTGLPLNQEGELYCQIHLSDSADLNTLALLVDNLNKKALRNKMPRIADIEGDTLVIQYNRADWTEIKGKLHELQFEFRQYDLERDLAMLLTLCKKK